MYVRARIVVSGIVQGVGYRYFVLKQGRRMELTGWVRNVPSGDVEIEAEGPRGLIEELIQLLWTGNPWATVRNVAVDWGMYSGKHTGFDITY